MIATTNCSHHGRSIAATFAVSAALLGSGSALVPAQAAAMNDQERTACESFGGEVVDTPTGGLICMRDGNEIYVSSGAAPSKPATASPVPKPSVPVVIRVSVSGNNRQPQPPDADSRVTTNRGGWDRGHASCKGASSVREGVCLPPVGKQKKKSLSEAMAEEREKVRRCREIEEEQRASEAHLRDFRAGRWDPGSDPKYRPMRPDSSFITDPDEKRRVYRDATKNLESDHRRFMHELGCDLRPLT